MELRWDPYVLRSGPDFTGYWQEFAGRRRSKVLYVLGRGFDPRMCLGLEGVRAAVPEWEVDVVQVHFQEGRDSPSTDHDDRITANVARLEESVPSERITVREVQMWSDDSLARRRVGSQQAAQVIESEAVVRSYDHLVIDISALPRSVYFTLTAKAIYLMDQIRAGGGTAPRLHLVVCENPTVDQSIRAVGLDDRAYYLHGFSGRLALEATTEVPILWIPVLGEGEEERYRRIYELVAPQEVCPVLPWPARDPRRPDNLFEEFRPVLIDRWPIDMRNIIYAAEANPFDVYRSIRSTVSHYRSAMRPLGGCKIALSALSSKLLSVGVLLAAYELKAEDKDVGLAHVDAQGHRLSDGNDGEEELVGESTLFAMSIQ